MSPKATDRKGAASAAPDLSKLAENIRAELAAVDGDHRSELEHAIRVGELLAEARTRVERGGWGRWLGRIKLPPKTANNYARLAANRPRVADCKSVREALAALKKPKAQSKKPRRKPTEAGRRLRELQTSGRTGDIWQLQKAVAEAARTLELFDLPDLNWSEETDAIILDMHDDLERHLRWNTRAFDVVIAHTSDLSRQRKIRQLRARADDQSSTEWERRTAAERAEVLEAKYREQKKLGA